MKGTLVITSKSIPDYMKIINLSVMSEVGLVPDRNGDLWFTITNITGNNVYETRKITTDLLKIVADIQSGKKEYFEIIKD